MFHQNMSTLNMLCHFIVLFDVIYDWNKVSWCQTAKIDCHKDLFFEVVFEPNTINNHT